LGDAIDIIGRISDEQSADQLIEAVNLLEGLLRQRSVAAYQASGLQVMASGQKPPRSIIGGAGEDDENASEDNSLEGKLSP
jgi:hypothetical protein